MPGKRIAAVAAGVALLLGTGEAGAVPVVVDSWSLTTEAADYVGDNRFVNRVTETAVQLPFNGTTTRSYGQSTCTNTYSFEVSDAGVAFSFGFSQIRGGHGPTAQNPEGSAAYSWGRVRFHVTEPVSYSISGEYAMSGSNGLSLGVFLVDSLQNAFFGNDQQSVAVVDESFTVGETGGANYNTLAGSPTGMLQPGEIYVLGYNYDLDARASDAGATAVGSLRFALTPEPGSVLLTLLAGVAACSARRRKRRFL